MARAENILVNAADIKAYGRKAQSSFDRIRAELQAISDEVARVRYTGPNASTFEREVSTMVAEFSQALLADMQSIAEAVRVATSNISQALGGEPIKIHVDGSPIRSMHPKIAHLSTGGDQSANVSDLQGLSQVLGTRFDSISTQLTVQLSSLRSTTWRGQGKQNAVELATRFTRGAQKHNTDAKREFSNFLQAQLAALDAADR